MYKTKCLKKAFMISRIAGMCPLSFDDGLPQIDYMLMPFSIFIMLFVCFQSIDFILQPPNFPIGWVPNISAIFQNLLLSFNLISSYLCLAFTKDTLKSVFLYFVDADMYLKKFGKKPSYTMNLFYDVLLMLLGSCMFLYCYAIDWNYSFRIAQIVQIHYGVLSLYISVQAFIKLAGLLKNRFMILNSTFIEISSSYQFGKNENLEIILKLHDILCRASEDLNKCFSFQLLLLTIIAFLNFTVSAYMTVIGMDKSLLIMTIFRSFILCFYAVLMTLLTNVCQTSAEEANRLQILLHERLLNEDTRKIKNIAKVEAYLLMRRKVEFKGYGFLILDHTLLLSMLGAATTYLVILLQVSNEPINTSPTDDVTPVY